MQQINSINVVGTEEFFGVLYGVLIPINHLKKNMIEYLKYLKKMKLSYSVLDTNKAMLIRKLLFWALIG